jgi:hypothetical protein
LGVKLAGRQDLPGTPVRKSGVRTFLVVLSIALCLALVGAAQAEVGLTLTTLNVRTGSILRGYGSGSGMPVYLVPERRAPRPFRCHGGKDYCTPRSWRPPGKPYVLLGHLRHTRSAYARQRFAFRVPAAAPGRYQVVLWCRPCGRTLLLAGSTLHGQVVTVRR